ncbi:MAG: HIT family protein [Balneolaceae bacterium]
MTDQKCPFCEPGREVIAENDHGYAVFDKYPVSDGHTLVISRRHVPDYFDLSDEEKTACWKLVDEVKKHLEAEYNPDGWNIGINTGSVAGQTVFHFHCHVIPRYRGDVINPTGGIRNVKPGMGEY